MHVAKKGFNVFEISNEENYMDNYHKIFFKHECFSSKNVHMILGFDQMKVLKKLSL